MMTRVKWSYPTVFSVKRSSLGWENILNPQQLYKKHLSLENKHRSTQSYTNNFNFGIVLLQSQKKWRNF